MSDEAQLIPSASSTPSKPSAPVNGQVSYFGPSQITFFWGVPVESGSAPIDKYELRAIFEDGSSQTYVIDSTTTSHTLTNVSEGVSVQVYVKASNDGGATYGSELAFPAAKPITAPSEGPLSASAIIVSLGKVKISWMAPQIDVKSKAYYRITSESSKETDPVIGSAILDLTQNSCELSGLNTTSTYTFKVVIVNNAGESPAVTTNSIKF